MNNESIQKALADIEQARNDGWDRPVAVSLPADSPHARAVYEAVLGRPYPADQEGRILTVQAERLAEVLKRHCGPGGAFVARAINDEALGVDAWLLDVGSEVMHFRGYLDGKEEASGTMRYDSQVRHAQTFGELLADGGPSRAIYLGECGTVVVFGRTGQAAVRAAALVSIVEKGTRQVRDDAGLWLDLPLDDDGLTAVLLGIFSEGDGPHQVAEAIRALKRLPGGKEKRILRLLANRSGLAELYRKVRFELDGGNGAVA